MTASREAAARREVEEIIARFSARSEKIETAVGSLRAGRITAPIAPTSVIYEPSLCMCVRGQKQMVVGDKRFVQDERTFVLFSAGMPAIVAVNEASPDRPYTALRIDLDLDVARQLMAEMGGAGTASTSETCMAFGNIDDSLLDAVLRLVRLIERPHEIAIMSKLIEREILYRLLSGPSGDRLRQIARIGSPSQRVAKAIEWLQGNYQEKFLTAELAAIAGMGNSTLYRHFQEVTTMSPLQFQKHLRLHEARRLMLTDGIEAGVAAYRVGYESPTQFNREYRRLFGTPPLRDVKSLRHSESTTHAP